MEHKNHNWFTEGFSAYLRSKNKDIDPHEMAGMALLLHETLKNGHVKPMDDRELSEARRLYIEGWNKAKSGL